MWNDHYEPTALDSYVTPLRLNQEHFQAHRKEDFFHVDEALKKMNLWPIVTLEEEFSLIKCANSFAPPTFMRAIKGRSPG
jgi:hypothetical protein